MQNSFKCTGTSGFKCDVTGENRSYCPACRLDKCVAVGMKSSYIFRGESHTSYLLYSSSLAIHLSLACRPGQPAEARPVHLQGTLHLVRAGNVPRRRVGRPPRGLKERQQLESRPERGHACELECVGRWPSARPPTRAMDRSQAAVDEHWSEFPQPASGEFDSK